MITECVINMSDLNIDKSKFNRQEVIEAIFDYLEQKYNDVVLTFDCAIECDGTIKVTDIIWNK